MTRIDLTTTKSVKLKTQGKYCAEDISIVPNLETLNITPTTAEQEFSVGSGFSGIGKVNLSAVNPADYYKPESVAEVTPTTETQNIKPTNGSVFNEVRVGAIQTEQTTIKTNGTHTPSAGKFFDKVVVEVADIPAVLQEKSVIPTRQPQTVLPDTNYEGMSKVEVGGIPAEFVVPSGSITATENKTYDVTEVKEVVVAVPEKADAKLITGSANQNGTYKASDYDADGFSEFVVEVAENTKEPILQDKEVTPTKETQVVTADEGFDGLNSTTVKSIPEEYIIPEGELKITENNKQFDVTDKKTVFVNVPNTGGGSGDVALNIVGVWTLGEGVGIYYRFNEDGTLEALQNCEVVMSGTYTIEGTTINTTINGEVSPLYYNTSDNGIGSEEGVSFMWRLTPSGSIEINSNGDYDVAHYIQAIVNVPNTGGGSGSGEYETINEMKLVDLIQNKTNGWVMPTEEEYIEQEQQVNELITILSGGTI